MAVYIRCLQYTVTKQRWLLIIGVAAALLAAAEMFHLCLSRADRVLERCTIRLKSNQIVAAVVLSHCHPLLT